MQHIDPERDDHDLGFAHDRRLLLPERTLSRRSALGLLTAGATGIALAVGPGTVQRARASTTTSTSTPEETAGPYPGDGSNGPDVLDVHGILRHDIRTSFGRATGRAHGVNLHVEMTVVHAASGKPHPGAAVYLWHCDQLGRYSLYSSGVTDQNYLRGIQVTGTHGRVRFHTIFPACYAGRWPHMHYEVYPSLRHAHAATDRLLTSQIAMRHSDARRVYADRRYTGSATNLTHVSLSTDMVFSDSYQQELPQMTGTAGHRDWTLHFTARI